MFKQSREVSVTFLVFLATFYFRVVKCKTFEVMLVLGAYNAYSAAVEWQTPEQLTNFQKYWFLIKLLVLLVMWVGGLKLPAGDSRLRAQLVPWSESSNLTWSNLIWALSSAGLVWQIFLFGRLGLANLTLRSPNASFRYAGSLDTQLKASSSLLGREL